MQTRLMARGSSYALVLLCCACGAKGSHESPAPNGMAGNNAIVMSPMNAMSSGSGGVSAQQPRAGTGGSTNGGGSAGTSGIAGKAGDDPTKPVAPTGEDPRGKCQIDSGFPDDNACLLAPDPSQGFQIHIGPANYDDPAEINKFIFHPGDESAECFSFHTPNKEEIFYQVFDLSGRAGTHHIINTMYSVAVTDGGFVDCLDPGTGTNGDIIDNLPGASRAWNPRATVAPENKGLARPIPANAGSQADMHYFNVTDQDILREFWMNVYFVPKEQVTEIGSQIRGMGGISWSALPIEPGTDMVYPYSCPIDKDGRIVELIGHYHAHGTRQTAYITRGATGARDKVFEMYDYKDPRTFYYDSITTNPMFSSAAPGAFSGQLDVKAGDSLDWECHVINDSNVGLTYTNEVKTGEMCNLWGFAVGPTLNCVLP